MLLIYSCLLFQLSVLNTLQASQQKIAKTVSFPKNRSQVWTYSLRPMDEIQADFEKKNQSLPSTQNLKKATESFKKKNFLTAVQLSSRLFHNRIYADLALWIAAESYRSMARSNLEKKAFSQAYRSALKGISLYSKIIHEYPRSPMLRSLTQVWAQTEWYVGESAWGMKRFEVAQKYFLLSLARLHPLNVTKLLTQINRNQIELFALSCAQHRSKDCQLWSYQLASLWKDPELEKKMETLFPKPFLTKLEEDLLRTPPPLAYKNLDRDQQAFEEAMSSFNAEKYSLSAEQWGTFFNLFPRSNLRHRARYWWAQALSYDQENNQASTLYAQLQADAPLTFYGLLASQMTHQRLESMMQADLPLGIEYDPQLLSEEWFHLNRAQALLKVQAKDLAKEELQAIPFREKFSSPFLVYLAWLNHEATHHSQVFRIMVELIQRRYAGVLSSFGLRMIFPSDAFPMIKKYALDLEIDPILILSLIKQESAFMKEAMSSVGAVGLMQIMPMTALSIDPQVSISQLLESETNLIIGIKYLKKMLTKYQGNRVLALAAYNAGPNATDRWLKENSQKKTMIHFIESIPYRETREYVGGIIRNYYWYQLLVQGEAWDDLSSFWKQDLQAKPQNENA